MRTSIQTAKNVDTVRCQELGDELVRLRKAAHLSVRETARITCIDQASITRFEKGHRAPTVGNLESLLTAYRADRPTRSYLRAVVEEAAEIGWWQKNRIDLAERQQTLVSLEARAESMVNVQPVLIPGLLQTSAYAGAVMREVAMVPEEAIEDKMVARLCRQSVLEQRTPPTLLAIIDELALHRVVGSPSILREQLDYLVQCAHRKRCVTIRVVPNKGRHAGTYVGFGLINQPDRRSVVWIEPPTSMLFVEEPSEVDFYRCVVNRLLADALDEGQSVELIASVATRLDTEEGTGCGVKPIGAG